MSGNGNGNGARPEDVLWPGRPRPDEPMTLEEIAASLRELVEARFPSLGPDDDVTQMTVVEGSEGAMVIGHPFGDDQEKELAVAAIVAAITMHRGEAWGQVMHGWTQPPDAPMPGEEGYVQPREREDKIEVVVVHASDGIRYVAWFAGVERDGENPPKLGEWEQKIECPALDAGGAMIAPLTEAVMAVRLARASRQLVMEPDEPRTPEQQEAFDRIDADLEASLGPGGVPPAENIEQTISDFVTLGLLEYDERGLPRPSAAVLEKAGLA